MKSTLLVKPLAARFISDQPQSPNAETFVRLKIGTHNYQSTPSKGLGASPVWHDEFNFDYNPKEKLGISVMSTDEHGEHSIGETVVDISHLASGEIKDKNYMLTLNGKEVGNIHLILFYEKNEEGEAHPRHAETPHPSFGFKFSNEDSGFPGPDNDDEFLVHANIHPPHFSE